MNYVQIGFLKEAFDAKELRVGTRVEHEHTKSNVLAKKIAKDHLREIPGYYKRLLPLVEHKKYANEISRDGDHAVVKHDGNSNKFLFPKLEPLTVKNRYNPTFSGVAEDAEKMAYTLLPHQERIGERLKHTDKLLMYHSTGAGKTLSILNAAKSLQMPLTVVGPAALKNNFQKEQEKYKTHVPTKVYTYSKPPTGDQSGVVAFDESHQMNQLESLRSHYPDLISGKKVIFASATPIKNFPSELIIPMRGLGIQAGRNTKVFNESFLKQVKENPGFFAKYFRGVSAGTHNEAKNLDVLRKALHGKVDYYQGGTAGYPKVTRENIEVKFTPEQASAYNMVQKGSPSLAYKIKNGISPSKAESKNLNAFLSGSRLTSNIAGDFNLKSSYKDAPKILRAVAEIKKYHTTNPDRFQSISFSNFLGHGILPMKRLLEKENIPFGIFTGKETDKKKKDIVEAYNSGKIKHLLISKAGAEGLDLKNTRLVQLLEPSWSRPNEAQMIGRAVRFQSHAGLPEGERTTHVQYFTANPPDRKFLFWKIKGGMGSDAYMNMLADRKEKLNNQFLKVLQDVGQEKIGFVLI